MLGSLLTFLSIVIITNLYDTTLAGEYFLYVSIIAIISIFALQGGNLRLMRSLASGGEDVVARLNIVVNALFTLILISFLIVFLYAMTSLIFPEINSNRALYFAVLAVLSYSSITLLSYAFQGLHKSTLSQFYQFSVIPIILIIIVVLTYVVLGIRVNLMLTHAIATVIASFVILIHFFYCISPKFKLDYLTIAAKSLRFSPPIFALFAMQLLLVMQQNIGQVALGLFSEPEDIAFFSVSKRLTILIGIVMTAVNAVVASRYSKAFSENDLQLVKDISKTATRLLLIAGVPICLIVFIFSPEILSIFGPEYENDNAVIALRILLIGQFFNVLTGTVSYVLIGANLESYYTASLVLSLLVTTLSILFFKDIGLIGVALSVCLGMIFVNLLAAFFCYKKLKINTMRIV